MNTPTKVDISGFNRGMTGFVDKLGIAGPVVLKKEMGELLKTLVRVTPPKLPARTRANIEGDVLTSFTVLAHNDVHFNSVDKPIGPSGIKWYRWNSSHLYGVEPDQDKTKSTPSELGALYYSTRVSVTKSNGGEIVGGTAYRTAPFKHPRRNQTVQLAARYLIKRSTANRLIKTIQSHVGRLKAGWLASWDVLAPGGSNKPPQWVMRHKSGARGYYINGLGVKGYPTFTIANTAKGVGNPKLKLDSLVRLALAIRVKAMKTNLGMFTHGKKSLIDYSR